MSVGHDNYYQKQGTWTIPDNFFETILTIQQKKITSIECELRRMNLRRNQYTTFSDR